MIRRLIEIKQTVNKVFESEWQKLEELVQVLEPFADHANIIQADTLALANILPMLLDLSCHMQDKAGDPNLPFSQEIGQWLLNELNRRFGMSVNAAADDYDPLPAAATLLDPSVAGIMITPDMDGYLSSAKGYIYRQVFQRSKAYVNNHRLQTDIDDFL